jgi:hypothetical protein
MTDYTWDIVVVQTTRIYATRGRFIFYACQTYVIRTTTPVIITRSSRHNLITNKRLNTALSKYKGGMDISALYLAYGKILNWRALGICIPPKANEVMYHA